jgi:hypothetical protein
MIMKVLVSAGVIVCASELAKRSTTLSALLISLPLVSLLSFVWVYWESKDVIKVADLSTSTLLLVVPSLMFFVILSPCLRNGVNFWLALAIACAGTAISYSVYYFVLDSIGWKI